jgi:two-component system, LytTR family, sensor kinase
MPRCAGYTGGVVRRLAIPLVACTLLGLLDAFHFGYYLYDNGLPIVPGRVLLRECPSWIAWALGVPIVIRWGQRFRLDWPPQVRPVLAHLAGVVAAILVFALVPAAVDHVLGSAWPRQPFWDVLRGNLVYQAPKGVITYGATVGLSYAAAHAARSRQLLELRSELSKAQLTALRMQLNPHFFFNTLHTIGALVRDGNQGGAVDMIAKLGDVLRRVLRTGGDPEAPLRDEIEFLREYLEIEQVRFGDRLQVAWHLDPLSESLPVPQLILQPLVENALRHGLSRRARPGSLTISSRVHDERLELVVADDGEGLPADLAARSSSGVGLANIRARLSQMYGDKAHLSLTPKEAGGVTARIVLPLRAAGEPRAAARE